MQCKYCQILLGLTCEWSLWRGGRFIEVVFKTGSTAVGNSAITEANQLRNIDITEFRCLDFSNVNLKFLTLDPLKW